MRRLSSTMARLVAAIFVLQLLSSALAIFFLRGQMLEVVQANHTRQVIDVRDDLLAAYYDGGRDGLANFIVQRRGSAGDPAVFVALTGQGDEVLSNLGRAPDLGVSPKPARLVIHRSSGQPDIEAVAQARILPDGSKLVVGIMDTAERRLDFAFAAAVGITIAVAAALALASSLVLGAVLSRRTHEIADTAAQLGRGNFGARLDIEDSGDGFDHLRRQMNLMAERIDNLVSQLSSVSGALAHDLRSPVARLTAAIDTSLTRVTEPRATEALMTARADADLLRQMLENALEISRLEAGAIEDRRVKLDLSTVAADLVELYEPLADQSGFVLNAQLEPVIVRADRELLSRALANLIDNALKYGGKHITVSTRAKGSYGIIEVADDGPGIPLDDRARAIERFVRLDNARTLPGGGLGLAMVSAVAKLHGGELVLSGENGLTAALHLRR